MTTELLADSKLLPKTPLKDNVEQSMEMTPTSCSRAQLCGHRKAEKKKTKY